MDGLQELCKTYHLALRVTNFEKALAPFGILRGAWVQSLHPEVLVQSIYALYPKDHTRPAVARALRRTAQVDDAPTRAHCREGGVGSAIRHLETHSFKNATDSAMSRTARVTALMWSIDQSGM